jgi:bifunctional DNA-binding transcriptional regulator/antitoxin component of YhaV-PrlF toxin-antitoxin module
MKIMEVQTFLLTINPKNRTVGIPKKARQLLGLRESFVMKVKDNKAEITVPKYTAQDVLFKLPPLTSKKKITKKQIRKSLADNAVERYLKKQS